MVRCTMLAQCSAAQCPLMPCEACERFAYGAFLSRFFFFFTSRARCAIDAMFWRQSVFHSGTYSRCYARDAMPRSVMRGNVC